MTFQSKLVFKGKWWLPNEPQNTKSGILTINLNESAILDIMDDSKPDINDLIVFNTTFGVNPTFILGEAIQSGNHGSNEFTLYKCFKIREIFTETNFNNAVYDVNTVFRGFHFQKLEDIKFDAIWIDYTGLHEWLNFSLFETYDDKEKKKDILEISSFEKILIMIDEKFRFKKIFIKGY